MKKLIFLILVFTIMSITDMTETRVHATVYNAVEEQCNEDPEHTAFMFKLDLDDPYKHRIIAVSRDLLDKYPNGTKVCVRGTEYDGIYTVRDKMARRSKHRGEIKKSIDILINVDMPIGSWKNVTITRVYD